MKPTTFAAALVIPLALIPLAAAGFFAAAGDEPVN
jgi:hypothetical protein